MSNIIGTASTTQQLQLEALNEVIKLLIEKEAKLDSRISERGSITPVSLRSFRLRFQTAFPGNVALFNLDAVSYTHLNLDSALGLRSGG